MSSKMFQNGSSAQDDGGPVPDPPDNGGQSSTIEDTNEGRPRSVRKRMAVERYNPLLLAASRNRGERIDVLINCDDEVIEVDIESDGHDDRPKKRSCSRGSRSSSSNSSSRQNNGNGKPKHLLSSADKCNAVDRKYSKRLGTKIDKTEVVAISAERDIQRSVNKVSTSAVEGFVLLDEKSSDGSSVSADRRVLQPRKAKQGRTYDEELLEAGFLPGIIHETTTTPSASTGITTEGDSDSSNEVEREQDVESVEAKKLPQSMIKQRNIFKQKYHKSASAGKSLHVKYKALSVKRARNKGVSTSLEQKRLQTGWDYSTSDSVRVRKQVSPYQYPEYPRASRPREREQRASKEEQNEVSVKSEEKTDVYENTSDEQKPEMEGDGRKETENSSSKPKNEDEPHPVKTETSPAPSAPNRLRQKMCRILRKKVAYSREHQERLYSEEKFVIETVNFDMMDVYPIWRILTKDKMLRKYEPVVIDGRVCHMAVDAFKITRFQVGEFESLFQPIVFDLLIDTSEFSVGVAHVMEESAHLYGYFADTDNLLDSYECFLQGIIAQALCGRNPFLNNLPTGLESVDMKLEELTRQMESCNFWPEEVKDLIVHNPFLRATVQNQTQVSELTPCSCCLYNNRKKVVFVRCYFRGQNYNRQSFAPVGELSEEVMEKCCRSCLHKILAFHRLYHYKYWLFLCVRDAIDRTRELVKDNQVLDAQDVFKFLMSDFKWTKHMFYDFQSVVAACEEEMRIHRSGNFKTSTKRIITLKELSLNSTKFNPQAGGHKQKLLRKHVPPISTHAKSTKKSNLKKSGENFNAVEPVQYNSKTLRLTPAPRVYSRKVPNPVAVLDELQFKKTETQKASSGVLNRTSEMTEQLYNLFDRLIAKTPENFNC